MTTATERIVTVDDAVVHMRELLAMTKDQLLRDANFADRICADKLKRTDVILYAFERKFNPEIRDPTIAMAARRR